LKESEFSEFQCKINALNSKYKGLNRFSQLILQILYGFYTAGFILLLYYTCNLYRKSFTVGYTENINENYGSWYCW